MNGNIFKVSYEFKTDFKETNKIYYCALFVLILHLRRSILNLWSNNSRNICALHYFIDNILMFITFRVLNLSATLGMDISVIFM